MSLEVELKMTRLILLEDFFVLLLGLDNPGLRWMFSEPDLLQRLYRSICDWEHKLSTTHVP